MKRLKDQKRSTVPPELCSFPHHSLCCNGRTRQRFASALCGGRSPAHGRLLAARPSGRQPSLRHGETGPRFVRIIVLGHLILTHRRQKRRTLCASQDETTSNCSTERRKNQGLIAGKKTNPCVLRRNMIWYRRRPWRRGADTTNTGGCSLPVPECRVRRFSWRFALPRRLRAERGDKSHEHFGIYRVALASRRCNLCDISDNVDCISQRR